MGGLQIGEAGHQVGDSYMERAAATNRATRRIQQLNADQQYYNGGSRYESYTGNGYKYDLNNPADRVLYDSDASAQVMDSINPHVRMDRNLNVYGGGIGSSSGRACLTSNDCGYGERCRSRSGGLGPACR